MQIVLYRQIHCLRFHFGLLRLRGLVCLLLLLAILGLLLLAVFSCLKLRDEKKKAMSAGNKNIEDLVILKVSSTQNMEIFVAFWPYAHTV